MFCQIRKTILMSQQNSSLKDGSKQKLKDLIHVHSQIVKFILLLVFHLVMEEELGNLTS